jgi:phospholipid N-methyltransferase
VTFQLLSRFLVSPRTIGSIMPSSKFLVKALTAPIDWANIRTIIEFGGGTGVVTEAIAERAHPDSEVIIFENDSVLRRQLKYNFPQFHHAQDARQMQTVLKEKKVTRVDAIISSLPFANFSSQWTNELLQRVSQLLSEYGVFVQYQYSLQLRKTLLQYFQQVDVKFVPINIPPSFVYICRKGTHS